MLASRTPPAAPATELTHAALRCVRRRREKSKKRRCHDPLPTVKTEKTQKAVLDEGGNVIRALTSAEREKGEKLVSRVFDLTELEDKKAALEQKEKELEEPVIPPGIRLKMLDWQKRMTASAATRHLNAASVITLLPGWKE